MLVVKSFKGSMFELVGAWRNDGVNVDISWKVI